MELMDCMDDVVPDLDRGRERKGGGRLGLELLGLSGVGMAAVLSDSAVVGLCLHGLVAEHPV